MKNYLLLISLITFFSCQPDGFVREDGLDAFSVSSLETHLKKIASDEFQGRLPFSEGERITLAYLEETFRNIGLEPGNGNSYLQEVPMVEITATPALSMTVQSGKRSFTLEGFKDYVIWTERTDEKIELKNEDIIFCGFGIVAPEYNWNDFAGADVKDKVIVVMVNDPGFGSDDNTLFKGNTMTYYGRWTYKFEEAARQGAKGVLIIHDDVPAGYGFWVVQNNWNAPRLYLDERGKNSYHCATVGWLTQSAARKLFEAAGMNWAETLTAARKPGFTAKPMNLKISTSLSVKARYDKSHNVIGKITGSKAPDEYIIYSTHWDHLGIGKPDAEGDSIYNGALDNASGTAGLLELAKAFKSMKAKPHRTLVFLAVTAEEQGLWGSEYYARNPVYPKEKTVANINMDGLNSYGKMKDIVVVGMGQSELEDYLQTEAEAMGRYLSPEPNPVAGYYFRSDHFCFARIGIPALYTNTGIDHIEKGKEYGKQLQDEYVAKYYHKPSDEYDPARWNLEGAVDDLKLLFNVGKRLAFEKTWPQWKEGSEFKAAR
ncbi:MAG: M28 family metallopeptidase [Cyclobacteriaceae bacterium]|nr:M28 family metallopeptidase [Cyclobacteriaceae bacterium]